MDIDSDSEVIVSGDIMIDGVVQVEVIKDKRKICIVGDTHVGADALKSLSKGHAIIRCHDDAEDFPNLRYQTASYDGQRSRSNWKTKKRQQKRH